MKQARYKYPLSIQLDMPGDYRSDRTFARRLALLQKFGFTGVELNIVAPDRIDRDGLKNLLDCYGLKLRMIATGAAALAHDLSLSEENADIRENALSLLKVFIDVGSEFEAGVIVGFLKGKPAQDSAKARDLFHDSLAQIMPYAEERSVPILVEATNRYESSVANSLEDTAALVSDFDSNTVKILPDTFHMNIEERDMLVSLEKYAGHYVSVHFSDNNRFYPGLGSLDFSRIVKLLVHINYEGQIALEGNIDEAFDLDVKRSVEYLSPILT